MKSELNFTGITWGLVGYAALLVSLGVPGVTHAQGNTDPKAETSAEGIATETLELTEMIARALRNHPEVATARARLLEAQANLDRARLDIAQRVVAHQETRRALTLKLKPEQAKLRELQKVNFKSANTVPQSQMTAQEVAVESIRGEIAALESQLPFILGEITGRMPTRVESTEARDLAEELVTHAEAGYQSATALYRGGKSMQHFVEVWSNRLLKSEDALHGETAANAERHLDRMQGLLDTVKPRLVGGVASNLDYAAAQYAVVEARRLLKMRQ